MNPDCTIIGWVFVDGLDCYKLLILCQSHSCGGKHGCCNNHLCNKPFEERLSLAMETSYEFSLTSLLNDVIVCRD